MVEVVGVLSPVFTSLQKGIPTKHIALSVE